MRAVRFCLEHPQVSRYRRFGRRKLCWTGQKKAERFRRPAKVSVIIRFYKSWKANFRIVGELSITCQLGGMLPGKARQKGR